jgi:hypothetical protein
MFDALSSASLTKFLEGGFEHFRFTYRSADIASTSVQNIALEFHCPRWPWTLVEGRSSSLRSEGLAMIQKAFIAYPNSPLLRNQSLVTQGMSFTVFDSGERVFLASDYTHGSSENDRDQNFQQRALGQLAWLESRTVLYVCLIIVVTVSICTGTSSRQKHKRNIAVRLSEGEQTPAVNDVRINVSKFA